MHNYFAFIGLLALTWAARADDTDQLQAIRVGHRAAVEAIRTFKASFEVSKTSPKHEVLSRGEYQRSGERVFIRVGKVNEWTSDFLIHQGETRVVNRFWTPGKSIRYVAERASSSDMIGPVDMWMGMLLTVVGPDGQPMSIDRILEHAKAKPRVSRERIDGHDCAKLVVVFDSMGQEVELTTWHDLKKNYLIRQRKTAIVSKDWAAVATITEFAEPARGVIVPVVQVTGSISGSKIILDSAIKLTDIIVNQDLDSKSFELPSIPKGTLLSDRMTKTRYPVDSTWRQIGPSKPHEVLKVEPVQDEDSPFTGPSTSEPMSSTRILLIVSLCLLVVAISAAAYRYYSRSR